MAYSDKFNEEIKLEILNEGQELIIQMFMKNGELLFRDKLAGHLRKDIDKYLSETADEPNQDWIDGVNYVIQLLREADFDDA